MEWIAESDPFVNYGTNWIRQWNIVQLKNVHSNKTLKPSP